MQHSSFSSDATNPLHDLQYNITTPVLASIATTALLTGCGAPSAPLPQDEMPASASSSSVSSVASVSSTPSAPQANAHEYTDGTYTANGSYVAPSGPESVTVSVTIKDDTVVDATYSAVSENPRSKKFQADFGAGYKALVTGKSVDTIALDVVNGSSLTPKGFMDALTKIKAQAKA